MESEKKIMLIFTLAIILLVVGILLICVRNYCEIYGGNLCSPKTPAVLSTVSALYIQLGILFFSLSAFWGGVFDRTLSEEVRKGMIFAAAMGIIALVILIVFQG